MSASQLQSLIETLTVLYKRPDCIIHDYSEEFMLAEISRRPGVMDELQEIMVFRSRLPAREKRFFPRSLSSLLSHWQATLDQARMYEPDPQDQSLHSRHLEAEIRRLSKEAGL